MKRIVVLAVLFLMIFSSSLASGRYIWITSSDEITFSFDAYSIKFGKKFNGDIDYYIIDTWMKYDYNEAGKERMKERYSDVKGIESISHSLNKYLYNNKTNCYRLVSTILYDDSGNVLYTYKNSQSNWDEIIPGSYAEMFEMVTFSYAQDKNIRYSMEQRSK